MRNVTVIVPVYNAAKYLPSCISSLLAQNYRDFELILVDDGSSDESHTICEQFRQQDKRICLIQQENKGVSAARNVGIDCARGQYVCFVDADDWVEPGYLTALLHCMEAGDLAICGVEVADADNLREETVSLQKLRQTPSLYTKNSYVNYSINKMYRTEILRKYAVSMPRGMRRGEDATFVLMYLSHCRQISICSQRLYHYRMVETSATHQFCTSICDDEAILTAAQYAFFHQEPLTDSEENAYLIWEHGKVMSVLRNIVEYAPDAQVRAEYIEQAIAIPRFYQACAHPPKCLGPRSKIYAQIVRKAPPRVLAAAIRLLR